MSHLFALFFLGSVALAQSDPSRLYMQGAAAYGEGRYADAAALFEQAYTLGAEPVLLYNLGLAYERAGEVARAIDAYERFLAAVPDAAERTEVERSLETLRRQRDLEAELREREARPEPIEPEVVPETVEAVAVPVEVAPGPSPSAAPWVIAGVGIAGVLAGVGVGVAAQSDYDAARGEPSHARAVALERSANDLATAANVCFFAGGAVALIGGIWGIVDVATLGPSEAPVAVRAGPGSISIAGRF